MWLYKKSLFLHEDFIPFFYELQTWFKYVR